MNRDNLFVGAIDENLAGREYMHSMRSEVANRFQHCGLHFEVLPVLESSSEQGVIDGLAVSTRTAESSVLAVSGSFAVWLAENSPGALTVQGTAAGQAVRLAANLH